MSKVISSSGQAARLEDRAASTPKTYRAGVGVEAALCSAGAAYLEMISAIGST